MRRSSLVLRPLPPYAFFTKLANISDENVHRAPSFEKKSRIVSSLWHNLSDNARKQIEAEAASSDTAQRLSEETAAAAMKKTTAVAAAASTSTTTSATADAAIDKATQSAKMSAADGDASSSGARDKKNSGSSGSDKKQVKPKKKKRKLTARQRYFRANYRKVLNIPFHMRLARLHRLFEQDARQRRGSGAGAWQRAAAQKVSKAESEAQEQRRRELKNFYRKAVSSSVSPRTRGPRR